MAFLEIILGRLLIKGASIGFEYRKTLRRRLYYSLFAKNKKIRISLSSILKVENESEFLLIKNRLRPEQYGPIGGALKYHSSATSFLNSIQFEADSTNNKVSGKILTRDLRGIILAKNLFSLIEWYEKGHDREDNCLHREIKEELTEINAQNLIEHLPTPDFSLIRKIYEYPHEVPGKSYLQFRIITVYSFSQDYLADSLIVDKIKQESRTNTNLIWVSSDEICQGVDQNNNVIGAHCAFLIGEKKYISEDRPWTLRK